MAKFIEDTKNKNEYDLFINLVSYEKSSDENDQGPATNVPLGDDVLGLTIIHVPKEDQSEPKSDVQGQEQIVIIEQGNNTQNQQQPTYIPPKDIAQQQEPEEEENDDDFELLPNGARARVSTPPSKRPAPSPKTN